jgi:hypothetical protein
MKKYKMENIKRNEGICKCGHHSKDHSYEFSENNSSGLECDKCDCKNYKFSHEE